MSTGRQRPALAVALAVGGPAWRRPSRRAGVTLRVAVTQDIDSLNPFIAVYLGVHARSAA